MVCNTEVSSFYFIYFVLYTLQITMFLLTFQEPNIRFQTLFLFIVEE